MNSRFPPFPRGVPLDRCGECWSRRRRRSKSGAAAFARASARAAGSDRLAPVAAACSFGSGGSGSPQRKLPSARDGRPSARARGRAMQGRRGAHSRHTSRGARSPTHPSATARVRSRVLPATPTCQDSQRTSDICSSGCLRRVSGPSRKGSSHPPTHGRDGEGCAAAVLRSQASASSIASSGRGRA